MSTIYVRTSGNDSTGTGATGAPYATLKKALSVAVVGDTILIAAGTYAENSGSGYLQSTTAWSTDISTRVLVTTESGLPDVIVTGTSGVYAVVLAASGLHFDNIIFRSQAAATTATVRLNTNTRNLLFTRCVIQTISAASGTPTAVFAAWTTASTAPKDIRFVKCTIEQQGALGAAGFVFDGSTTGVTASDVEVRDCDITVGTFGIRVIGVTNVRVQGNTIDCFSPTVTGTGLQLGVDGSGGTPVSGWVIGNRVRTVNGHAGVIGSGCNGVDLADNTWHGGRNSSNGQGLVLKECQNVRVEGDVITGGYLSGLYFKAAVDTVVVGCAIYNEFSTSPGVRVQRNTGDTDNPCQRLTFRRNVIVAIDGPALSWGAGTEDSGGSYCDENVYVLRGAGATLGTIRGTPVSTLTELRAAWSGYDRPVNDANSRVSTTEVTFGGAPLIPLPT